MLIFNCFLLISIKYTLRKGDCLTIFKNAFPILEYDDEKDGVIIPNRNGKALLPEICVITFFREVLEDFVTKYKSEIRHYYRSEMANFPIYVLDYKGIELGIIQAVVGSASIAMMTDYLISYGVKKIVACGGCGVLVDIPAGDVIIPVKALRDEGASYHYLPPSRDIDLNVEMISMIRKTLDDNDVPYLECKTWTTDALFRETPDMIKYRREEGCQVVEMECATMAAIAQFRGIKFAQLLYSGDILFDLSNYNDRNWFTNLTAREKLFYLALESVININHI